MTGEELSREQFNYEEHIASFVSGFVGKLFNEGIVNEIDANNLRKWFSNPDQYQKEIEKASEYYYISNGETFQLFDLARVLPTLNYKIDAFEKDKSYEKHISTINKILHKVKHKILTRDIISQTILAGTFCGIWVGTKTKPYFYIFDDLSMVFPHSLINGEWLVAVDMGILETKSQYDRELFYQNLHPYITESDFKRYQSNREKYKYVYLPQDKTAVIRTHALKRNQSRGVGWATQGLYDILHKKKLKDLEKSVANKIINAVAVLTIGDTKLPENTNSKLPSPVKKKVHSGVKNALEKSNADGVTLISIPDYAKLEFPDIKAGDSLEPDKFESINLDIMASYGLSPAVLSGTGGNFASAKLNLEVFYKRLAVLLEEIETQVFGKLLNFILPPKQSDNFRMEYDKTPPLSTKEKVDVLKNLHTQEGFSLKAILDLLDGVNYSEYVDQSIYEQEVQKLQERIKPYASAFTQSNKENKSGRPSDDNPTNENTQKSKENDSNNLPE